MKKIKDTPPISNEDLQYGKTVFSTLKTEKGPLYEHFGSDGCGYVSYGLYKSKSDKIYIICVSLTFAFEPNTRFTTYTLVDDAWWPEL